MSIRNNENFLLQFGFSLKVSIQLNRNFPNSAYKSFYKFILEPYTTWSTISPVNVCSLASFNWIEKKNLLILLQFSIQVGDYCVPESRNACAFAFWVKSQPAYPSQCGHFNQFLTLWIRQYKWSLYHWLNLPEGMEFELPHQHSYYFHLSFIVWNIVGCQSCKTGSNCEWNLQPIF